MAGIIATAQQPTLDANGNPLVPATAPAAQTATTTTTTPSTTPADPNGPVIGTGYQAAQIGDPTKWNVDASQTVAGQLKNLTDPNDPLNVQAATRATQEANAKGLSNSSLAITAGQDAILKNAMPIAATDAAAYGKAAGYNADQINQATTANVASKNQSLAFDANADNTAAGQNLGAKTQNYATDKSASTSIANTGTQALTSLSIANLDAASKQVLQSIDANSKTLIQSTQSGTSAFNQAMQSMQAIAANKDMAPEFKQSATDQVVQNLRNSLNVIGKLNNVDITSLLNFTNTPGTSGYVPTAAQAAAQAPLVAASQAATAAQLSAQQQQQALYDSIAAQAATGSG